ncbi:MAG: tetratricopeptide repeat protein [Exilispira sp.]
MKENLYLINKKLISNQKLIIFLSFLIVLIFFFFSFQKDYDNKTSSQYNSDDEDRIIVDSQQLIKEGNYSRALSILLGEFNKNNKSSKIPEQIASIFFSQQVYDLALKYFLISYKNGLKKVEIIEKIGESYAYLNNNKKAIEYLQLAFYNGNSDPYYLYSLIWVLLKEKKFEQAYALLELGESLYPNISYFIGAKALYYANIYDIEKARVEYEKALQLTASYSPLYFYNWGVMEFQLRNFSKAEELFLSASTFVNFGEAFFALGEIYLNKADLIKAEKYFLTGKPLLKSPFILYELIYLYALKGDKDKLISVYKSIKKYPNKWWIYQYNLNLYEQLMNYYQLESFYYEKLIQIEKKSFYLNNLKLLKSRLDIIYYNFLRIIANIRFKYYASLHLANIDKKLERLNFYQVARKVLSSFPLIEKVLILKEKNIFESITLNEGYIYYLYYAQKVNSKKLKNQYLDYFLKKADKNYEQLERITAFEIKAYMNRKNINLYLNIISEIGKILPSYFSSSGLKIPVNIKYTGEKDKIKIIKRYLKTKGFILNKKSNFKINVDCSDIYNFVTEYNGNINFFSLTYDDIIQDRISFYSNILNIFND